MLNLPVKFKASNQGLLPVSLTSMYIKYLSALYLSHCVMLSNNTGRPPGRLGAAVSDPVPAPLEFVCFEQNDSIQRLLQRIASFVNVSNLSSNHIAPCLICIIVTALPWISNTIHFQRQMILIAHSWRYEINATGLCFEHRKHTDIINTVIRCLMKHLGSLSVRGCYYIPQDQGYYTCMVTFVYWNGGQFNGCIRIRSSSLYILLVSASFTAFYQWRKP